MEGARAKALRFICLRTVLGITSVAVTMLSQRPSVRSNGVCGSVRKSSSQTSRLPARRQAVAAAALAEVGQGMEHQIVKLRLGIFDQIWHNSPAEIAHGAGGGHIDNVRIASCLLSSRSRRSHSLSTMVPMLWPTRVISYAADVGRVVLEACSPCNRSRNISMAPMVEKSVALSRRCFALTDGGGIEIGIGWITTKVAVEGDQGSPRHDLPGGDRPVDQRLGKKFCGAGSGRKVRPSASCARDSHRKSGPM